MSTSMMEVPITFRMGRNERMVGIYGADSLIFVARSTI